MLATEPAPTIPPAGLGWIEAAMVIFFVVFVGIVLVVVFARRGKYDDDARIPLEDGVVTPRDGAPTLSDPSPSTPRPPRSESRS